MDLNQILADPRRRNLGILAAAALVSLLLAIAALWQESSQGSMPAQTEFLPGFAAHESEAARIHIESKSGAFDVELGPEKGWVVRQRNDYPASIDLVHRTLVGLGALRTIEPKTARPEWLHFLNLDTPPQGDGILIAVSDDKRRPLGAVIAGKSEDIGDTTGATGLFARRPGENQSWLVRSVMDPRAAVSDWLDKHVMDVDRARIREVDADPAGSPSFVVSRARPSDPDFTLTPIPAAKAVSDPTVPDGVASAIADFGFDDVRPARGLDFNDPATAARLITKTFDGLVVTVHVVKTGADYWAVVSAEAAAPSTPAAAKEAAAINAHASGWAYKLPAFKGQLFMTTLDSLLKPPPAPSAPQP
ncbi:MAG: DUF4340 domain-containing protein [Rhizomicrobium sp.]